MKIFECLSLLMVQGYWVILLIWSLQMRTSIRALTEFMTKFFLLHCLKSSDGRFMQSLWDLCTNLWALVLLSPINISVTNMTFICRHALLFEDIGGEYNIPVALNSKSVREFDESLTRGTYFLYNLNCIVMEPLFLQHYLSLCSRFWF